VSKAFKLQLAARPAQAGGKDLPRTGFVQTYPRHDTICTHVPSVGDSRRDQ